MKRSPLRCPFCGQAPYLEPHGEPSRERTCISCYAPACSVHPSVTAPTRTLALSIWNTRPLAEAALRATLENQTK